jgi:hypothetical protein
VREQPHNTAYDAKSGMAAASDDLHLPGTMAGHLGSSLR